jgi:manganese-dependent inorganic pyrophosphatase
MKSILVTCYVNPDLDGVAGAIGYGEFLLKTGKSVEVGIIGDIHDEAKYLLERFKIAYPKVILNSDDYDEVVLVDASDLNGLEDKISPLKIIELIDHRPVNDADQFPNAQKQIEMVGAAATLIAEKFMQNNVQISKESAILIYGAIISNTLNFKGSVTTERDRIAADWLNQTAKLPESFPSELFAAKSDLLGSRLAERVEGDFAWFTFGGKKLGIAQLEIIGAKKLVEYRGEEIAQILNTIKNRMGLDLIFQNTIDLEEGANYLFADDKLTQQLLGITLDVKFLGNVAYRPNVLMRKQIVPLLKAELEK